MSLEILVAKVCVQIKFSDIRFLNPVNPVSIYVYIDTGWKITSVKFLQPVSQDSITISKFATILPDTSRPPDMCCCGKAFDYVLIVAAHDTKAHKNGYKCGYEVGTGVICDKSYNEKGKCWKHMRIVHLKLFNKKCKYADCLWQGCDEEAERLQHNVKKHGEVHPEIICVECKTTFSQINKLKKHFKKCGN